GENGADPEGIRKPGPCEVETIPIGLYSLHDTCPFCGAGLHVGRAMTQIHTAPSVPMLSLRGVLASVFEVWHVHLADFCEIVILVGCPAQVCEHFCVGAGGIAQAVARVSGGGIAGFRDLG